MWFWIISLAATVLCLLFFGRYNLRAVVRDWTFALPMSGRRAVNLLQEKVELTARMISFACEQADKARNDADLAVAVHFLKLALSVVEEAIPDRLMRLRAMEAACWMAAAMAPVPTLRGSRFQSRRLRRAADVARFLQSLMLTTAERFHLRLKLLTWGYWYVRKAARVSVGAAATRPGWQPAWTEFTRATNDFSTLDAEKVKAFRTLMLSLSAERQQPTLVAEAPGTH